MIQDRYLSNNKDEKRYKIIIVGDSNVGKTALFWRFTEGDFLAEKQTQIKNITLKEKPAKLYIWDTAGQEKYRSIVSTYFKGCHGVMMVFDLSRETSFKNIKEQWYDLCKSKAEKAMMVLIGNKSDLDKRVSQDEINEWCNSMKIKYISTSVKTGQNVEEAFMSLARLVHQNEEKSSMMGKSQSFSLKKEKEEKKGCC